MFKTGDQVRLFNRRNGKELTSPFYPKSKEVVVGVNPSGSICVTDEQGCVTMIRGIDDPDIRIQAI